ncbi:Self-incompatibility protein S1 [Linum perenne]
MKTTRLLISLLLLSIVIINSVPPSEAVTVRIINALSDHNKRLLVHCKSGDDDLGSKYIVWGEDHYHFSFFPSIFGNTLFWCYVAPDANTHVSFTAWADDDPLIPAGYADDATWLAMDDGVYVNRRIRKDKGFRLYRKYSHGKK